MSRTQYQIAVDSGQLGDDIHLVKPLVNEEYFIIPKEEALKELAKWKDITKTTSERWYPYNKKKNEMIYATIYGGYGTSQGGAPPGTEGYFNKSFPPDSNSSMGSATTPKQARAILLAKKPVNEELEEFNEAEETGKVEISKVLKEEITDDSELANTLIGTPIVETPPVITPPAVTTPAVTTPITTEKPPVGTKVPPIIINHAECGHLTFGEEKDGETERRRDVGLYAGDSNALRLFRDGGFELRSSESEGANQTKGSSIMQVCNNAPLTIDSEGNITIRAKNKLILKADLVEIESTNASEDGVTIIAEHDIKLRAKNNTIITSDNITIDAKERIVSHSEGWQILIGQCIRLHEPQTKICPAFMKEYIDGQIKTLKG